MTDFTTAFKSTIDKLGNDLAVAESLKLIDLDDLALSSELMKSERDALVWEFLTFDTNPVDPLYSFSFRIGARTVNDAANYNILRLVDAVKGVFPVQSRGLVRDYSGAVAGPAVGTFFITDIRVDPQQYDKNSGLRMILVSGKSVRNV